MTTSRQKKLLIKDDNNKVIDSIMIPAGMSVADGIKLYKQQQNEQ